MVDASRVAITGLQVFQRALATTSNNVANVGTEGYTRQRVDITTRPSQRFGDGFFGSGARVSSVQRIEDQFLNARVQSSSSDVARLDSYLSLVNRVENLVSGSQGGLDSALQNFFNSLQDLSNDPASIPARQVVLSNSDTLVARFKDLDASYNDINREINTRLRGDINDINSLTSGIADLNKAIVEAKATTSGQGVPNDLVDQRNVLVGRLSERLAVNTVELSDGSINVFVGGGESVVIGSLSRQLSAINDPANPGELRVGIEVGSSAFDITDKITGGSVSGLLDFRSEQLGEIRNQTGRLALVLANEFNAQHQAGLDVNGSLGAQFFASSTPQTLANQNNTGAATVTTGITDFNQLTTSDYELSYDGANYTLTRLSDGVSTSAVAGPFNIDGIQVDIAGAAAAGDSFLVQPTRNGASGIGVLLTNTSQIAAASPVRSLESTANLGSAVVTTPEVLDVNNADLFDTVEIRFNSPASTFDIVNVTDGATIAAGVAYTNNADIDFNGIRVQIQNQPEAGDVFTIERNTGGVGDNTNAVALLGLQTAQTVGGNATLQEGYGALVSKIGTVSRQTSISSQTQQALFDQAVQARDNVSGVNLDEEAVDLVRYQQAYQAAAQVISTSNILFDTFLAAVRR
ncbi:MAG: flagellar hook-associated protein FlgK [Gammaproteobacteria bacterium]|nr:flagellar hook-associated protein FlgK [Gammaproteobacteria bacterium]NNC68653.1 flagellar hook-associated protein FlgK [Gammaproteobacteria bacterium]